MTTTGKVYDKGGYLVKSNVKVTIMLNCILIGRTTYPIDDVTINKKERTITGCAGWYVQY